MWCDCREARPAAERWAVLVNGGDAAVLNLSEHDGQSTPAPVQPAGVQCFPQSSCVVIQSFLGNGRRFAQRMIAMRPDFAGWGTHAMGTVSIVKMGLLWGSGSPAPPSVHMS